MEKLVPQEKNEWRPFITSNNLYEEIFIVTAIVFVCILYLQESAASYKWSTSDKRLVALNGT